MVFTSIELCLVRYLSQLYNHFFLTLVSRPTNQLYEYESELHYYAQKNAEPVSFNGCL